MALQMAKAREVQISLELSQILSIDHMLKDIVAESLSYPLRGDSRAFPVLVGGCLMARLVTPWCVICERKSAAGWVCDAVLAMQPGKRLCFSYKSMSALCIT